MKKKRAANEYEGVKLKVYTRNDEAEYFIINTKDVTEQSFLGYSDLKSDLKQGDIITGILECDEYNIKIRYKGVIEKLKHNKDLTVFAVNFKEDLEIPEIFIAKSLAMAI